MNRRFWQGKKVFITGHTGFKGSWLTCWLHMMGAEISGYGLLPPTVPALYTLLGVDRDIVSYEHDIRDTDALENAVKETRPEVVFHLAAQSLVRRSYREPVETFSTNVMGTVNLLQALRNVESVRAIINVTSDKCYENKEWPWGYRENDPVGGYDPYSCSKGCSELITNAFRNSYYSTGNVGIATTRAGNVIGGGDWAEDRLIPDLMRAFQSGETAYIRNPRAYRPWQHVLEPLSGYLTLAEKVCHDPLKYSEPWNFGPADEGVISVGDLASRAAQFWGQGAKVELANNQAGLHEATQLRLDCSKALLKLHWRPVLPITQALKWTIEWYRSNAEGENMREYTKNQISKYEKHLEEMEKAVYE